MKAVSFYEAMPFYEKVGNLVKQINSANNSEEKVIVVRIDTIHRIVLLNNHDLYKGSGYWTLCCVDDDYTDENGKDIFSLCPIRIFYKLEEAIAAFNALTE